MVLVVVGAEIVGNKARLVFGFLEKGINYTVSVFIIN